MKKQELSGRLRKIVVSAGRLARELGHSYVGTEHLLLAMTQETGGAAGRVLLSMGLEDTSVRCLVLAGAGLGSRTLFLPQGLSPRAKRAVRRAGVEARQLGGGQILPEHLLLALTRDEACAAQRLMEQPELIEKARAELIQKNGGSYRCPLPDYVEPPIGRY